MNDQDIPFEYTFSMNSAFLSQFDEDFINFVIDNYEFKDDLYHYKFSFPSDKNGVIGTINSLNFRDSISYFIIGNPYHEVYTACKANEADMFYLDFIDAFIMRTLFEIHYMRDYQTASINFIRGVNKDPVKNNSLKTRILNYISLLELENLDNYSLNLKNNKYTDSDYTYSIVNNKKLQKHIYAFLKDDFKELLDSIAKESNQSYVGQALVLLNQIGLKPAFKKEYLKSLLEYTDLLTPNGNLNNYSRLYILLINTLNDLFNQAFDLYFEESDNIPKKNNLNKNLAILHSLSIFDLIPKEDKIYDILYREDTTRHEVKDAVKDFMRNKLYK